MITWLKNFIDRYVFSENLSISARTINMIYLLGVAAAICVTATRVIMGASLVLISIIMSIGLCVAILMYICNRFKAYTLCTWITVIVLCDILFPLAFFYLGGIDSSMVGFFLVSVVLVFFFLRGRGFAIMLVIHLALIITVYIVGTQPQFAGFVVHLSPEQRLLDSIFAIITMGCLLGTIVKFQSAIYRDEQQKTVAAIENLAVAKKSLEADEKLLLVVSRMAEMLLLARGEDLEKTLKVAMATIGQNLDIDRLYIWRDGIRDGKRVYVQEHEWLAREFDHLNTVRSKMAFNYIETLPLWEELFPQGKVVNGPINTLTPSERDLLSKFEIVSVLIIPVFLDKKFWGFVSFDNCHSEHTFSEDEVNILQSGALMLVNAIENSNFEQALKLRLAQQELMSKISQSFISDKPMEELIDDALRKVGEFLGVTRLLIATADTATKETRVMYRWAASEAWQPVPTRTSFKDILVNAFPSRMPLNGSVKAVYCNNTQLDYDGKYCILEQADIKSFIWAPIYVESEFWGMLSVEECVDYRTWNESDRQLVGAVVSAIAGGVARDIIEKERETALTEAISASKAKGDFLSNMSHEMRTPMNAIIGMTSIGASAANIERKDYAFGKIGDASTHLLGVINDILDMSKIEANKLELAVAPFEFRHMVRRVVDVITFRAKERKQTLTVDIDEHIPAWLTGDDQRLAQVLTNLLGNAVKFTPEGGSIGLAAKLLTSKGEPSPSCHLPAQPANPDSELQSGRGATSEPLTLQIKITDTGIGITQEQMGRLFTSFEQAERGTQRKFGGTGLGLAISKRIVEMMDGSIWVESEVNKGSTFAFTCLVERASKQSAPSKDTYAKAGAPVAASDFSAYHVLMAEDVEINQEIVLALLEPTGLHIECVNNGVKAVERFKEYSNDFDAIFMDVQMPEMDGYEATRTIRALKIPQARTIPIIAMTANVFKEDIEKCLAAGMNDHVGKPVNIQEVEAKLRKYLRPAVLADAGH